MNYIPQQIEGKDYILFAAQLLKCPICGKGMVHSTGNSYYYSFFPVYLAMNQDAQMKRAGLVYVSNTKVDNKPICKECETNDKAYFECSLCEQRKPTSKIEFSVGDPVECLCKDCYATIPAKEWDEKVEELEEGHRYDYE